MPSNIIHATPTEVLPIGLYSAFTEELRYEVRINEYVGGESERLALSLNPRRFWKLSRGLTPVQWSTLRNFYFGHRGTPFWFYAPRETVPPWHPDPTGAATVGRYTVVFDGSWVEDLRIGRSQGTFGLREVV